MEESKRFFCYLVREIILILSLFIGISGSAQSNYAEIYNNAEHLFQIDQFQKSLNETEKLIQLIQYQVDDNSDLYFNSYLLKGDCLNSLNKYKLAIEAYLQAVKIAEEYEGESFNYAFANHTLGIVYNKIELLENAENAFLTAGQIYENSIGIENEYYLILLEDLANLYIKTGNKKFAFSIFSIFAPLEEKINGYPPHSQVGVNFLKLAELAFYFEDYSLAVSSAEKAFFVFDEYQPGQKEKIIKTLLLLAKSYFHIGNYYLVLPIYKEVEKIIDNDHNLLIYTNDILYYKGLASYELKDFNGAIQALNEVQLSLSGVELIIAKYTLSLALSATGDKIEALSSMKFVLDQFLNEMDYDLDIHVDLLNEIALLEWSLTSYENAFNTFNKVLLLLGDENYEMKLKVLANQATLYSQLGDYTKAENIYLEVLTAVENNQNKKGFFLTILNGLGMLYLDLGEYSKCELLLNECLQLTNDYYGVHSFEYANARNNLGSFYFEVGNYNQSIDHFVSALDVYEAENNSNSIEYSSILNNIGMLFLEVEDYQGALLFLDSTRVIELNLIGDNHPDYASTLNNLSKVYSNLNEYKKAETCINKAVEILKAHFLNRHPDLALYQMNSGLLQLEQGRVTKASVLLKSSLDLHNEIYGQGHPKYAIAQFHYASVLFKQHKIKEAIPLFNNSITDLQKHLIDYLPFLSEKEKTGFYNQFIKYFHSYFSFAFEAKLIDPNIQKQVFNLSITLKGLLLRSSKAMRNIVLNSGDKELIRTYDSWVNIKKRISEISSLPIDQRSDNFNKLKKEANTYEKKLYQLSNDLGANKLSKTSWEEVKNSLKEKEAVIEFVSYEIPYSKVTKYAALILKHNSEQPIFIELFDEGELLEIIGVYGANNFDYINKVYNYSVERKTQLYDLIWRPLENSLGDAKKVFVSSTGLLHRISLYAIATGENSYLINAYELVLLNSSADKLYFDQVNSSQINNIALMGGINYNSEKSENDVWQYLPGSKNEVMAINQFLEKKKKNVTLKTFDEATETYFKEISEQSDILHIATHGFFFPDPKKISKMFEDVDKELIKEVEFRGNSKVIGVSSFTANKDPLMRSGLVFAGVHDLWSGEYVTKRDDGILTALEVSQLNLTQTKLAILSACETGLGEIIGDEGVYGLKRTFKIAGVKKIIISLWQVPDKETMEFMLLFYKNLYKSDDTTIYNAFEATQREMSELYDPYFWAAFILIN